MKNFIKTVYRNMNNNDFKINLQERSVAFINNEGYLYVLDANSKTIKIIMNKTIDEFDKEINGDENWIHNIMKKYRVYSVSVVRQPATNNFYVSFRTTNNKVNEVLIEGKTIHFRDEKEIERIIKNI
jgi:hypothetical protein